ncbi:MAG: hypothetical protein H6974_07020 [Gammaproteobacteria bacterium]|nr:hypothetical protein [Gammaproteobacteria bacterium]MCP5196524.1 hypothetical protein [Gammaproteobacteria bacterium]
MSRRLIRDEDFKDCHRSTQQAFTRIRALLFAKVLILILRKGVKSLQNRVSEVFRGLGIDSVTASAFSQACYKLRHEAFIELNREAIVTTL